MTATLAKPLLRIGDLAELCGVSAATIRRWRAAGTLPPAVRLGKRAIRWREKDIAKWLAARCPSKAHN